MAEPTILQEKLAVAWGLALAAIPLTEKVEPRTELEDLRRQLSELRADAEETNARCQGEAAAVPEGDELRAKAQLTKSRAAELALTWFKAGTDGLGAWTFLAMGEAAEVSAWVAVEQLAEHAEDERVLELARWALELQRRHLDVVLDGVSALAAVELPLRPAIH